MLSVLAKNVNTGFKHLTGSVHFDVLISNPIGYPISLNDKGLPITITNKTIDMHVACLSQRLEV